MEEAGCTENVACFSVSEDCRWKSKDIRSGNYKRRQGGSTLFSLAYPGLAGGVKDKAQMEQELFDDICRLDQRSNICFLKQQID